jgi:hypothetical protein
LDTPILLATAIVKAKNLGLMIELEEAEVVGEIYAMRDEGKISEQFLKLYLKKVFHHQQARND